MLKAFNISVGKLTAYPIMEIIINIPTLLVTFMGYTRIAELLPDLAITAEAFLSVKGFF